MGLTHFPSGLSSFGVPVMGGGSIPQTTGTYFFVDDGGSNANDGKDPDHPVATIDYAVGQCTQNVGDVIIVMPGHNESLTSGTSLVVDVAGITIIGLGQGRSRPVLDFDNTAASIEMDAANCRLSNLVLRASVTAVVVGINVDADDIEIDHIATAWETTGDDFKVMIDVDAFDRCHIHDCQLNAELSVAGWEHAIRLDQAEETIIEDCIFFGEWTEGAIFGEGALSQHILIRNCVIYNCSAATYAGIDFGALSSTGIIQNVAITALYTGGVIEQVMRDGDLTCHNVTIVNDLSECNSLNTGPTTTGT